MESKIYKNTIIAALIGIVVVGYVLFGWYIPILENIKEAEKELKKTEARNNQIGKLGKDDKFFSDLSERVSLLNEEACSYLPKKVKLSSLLRELSILAKQNNVNLVSIRPVDDKNQISMMPSVDMDIQDDYTRSLIEIVLSSSYENLGYYIKSIENSSLTVIAIKNIAITGTKKEQENYNPNALQISLTIEAYYKN